VLWTTPTNTTLIEEQAARINSNSTSNTSMTNINAGVLK
jgi:hypothetical protein